MTTQFKHVWLALAGCALAGSSMSGCAAAPPYNPDNLDEPQFAQVSGICQRVMGLRPSEPLSSGPWLGNDRLDFWTSHYRGCVTTLSDFVQQIADVDTARQADADCRAKGLKPETPDLALCVLRSVGGDPQPSAARPSAAVATPVSETLPEASGSFFYASPHETVRREQIACAALGLEPSRDEFKSCVRALDSTFYAIDHPIN